MRIVLAGRFGVPPSVLLPLERSLARDGHDVAIVPLGFNLDCGEPTVDRLERSAEAGPAPVTVIGHSRGGQLARVLAVRRPDLVGRLVTVATPWSIGPPHRFGVRTGTAVLRALRRTGVDLLPAIDCAHGPCCVDFRRDMDQKPAARWIALWSRRDGIARNDAVPPETADVTVDISTSHIGAVRSPQGIAAVRAALTA